MTTPYFVGWHFVFVVKGAEDLPDLESPQGASTPPPENLSCILLDA